ncbi:MAG: peptidylprolyl isomerase [Saprospiraceae bacterium]|nr:peptidylprolyl isomerase [Saprospiraceae bacterium]
MIKYKLFLIPALLFLTMSVNAQSYLIDKVIARVGGENILLSEVEDEYAYMVTSKATVTPDAKCEILKNLIAQKLIVYQAKLDSVEVTEEEVESQLSFRFESILRQMNGDEAFFREYYGATVNEMKERFREDQRQKLLAEKMQTQLIDNVSITPAEVLEFYNGIPRDSLPYLSSEVELGEIIVVPEVNDEEKRKALDIITGLKERIEKGEDFSELASRYSVDKESAKKGGDLGYAKRGIFVPEFEAAAFTLQKDEMSDIVETEFGYHLIKLLERKGNTIHAKHILISPEITAADRNFAKNKLDSIRTLIASDSMTFEAAVKKFSLKTAPSYSNNGKMKNPNTGTNYFETKDLDPDTYFAIDKLNVGDLSSVLEVKDLKGEKMYRLLKLQSKSKPHQANLKQDYDKIAYYAKESKKAQYFNGWIEEKMKKAYINVDPLYADCETLLPWIRMGE